jgi:hypothetical protein
MRIDRRGFLKSMGAVALLAALGRPVSLGETEYCLSMSLDGDLSKYIHLESMKASGGSVACVVGIDEKWVQDCVTITDQYNRRWSIVGYFEGLKSPEGWEISLETDTE